MKLNTNENNSVIKPPCAITRFIKNVYNRVYTHYMA